MIKSEKSLLSNIVIIFITSILTLNILTIVANQYYFGNNIEEIALENAVKKTKERETLVSNFVEFKSKQILFIRNSKEFKSYLNNENNNDINEFFYNFMTLNSDFMQLRYLDKNGKEKIRFDREFYNGDIFKISQNNLQDKANRYYFENSQKKELEKVWITPIDFNVENSNKTNDITLRVVLPIKNDSNQFNGILIINLFAEEFIQNVANAPLYNITLVNDYGKIIYYRGDENITLKRYIYDYSPKINREFLTKSFYKDEKLVYYKFNTNIENGLNIIFKLKNSNLLKQNSSNLNQSFLFSLISFIILLTIFYIIFRMVISHYRQTSAHIKKLYEQSLERVDDYILYSKTNLNGKITYASRGFCEISGYKEDELIGNSHNIIRHQDVNDFVFKDMWETIKQEKIWSDIIKNRAKNGKAYYVQTTIVPDYNEKNEHIGYISVRKDITAEIKLEKRKTFIETVLNTSDSIILTTDGIELQSINQRFFDIFDFKDLKDFKSKHKNISELFVQKEEFFLMPQKEGKSWLEQLEYIPIQSTLKINKACMIDKNGNERIFQVKSSGKLYSYRNEEVITLSEITLLVKNRKLLESQTKYAAMGEMISMIAHQWSQPLASLTTINAKIKTMFTLNRLDKNTLDKSFEKANTLISHLSNTVNDFRNYFHKDDIAIKSTISNEVDKALEIFEDLLLNKDIKIYKDYSLNAENLPIEIYGSRLKQVKILIEI